MPRKNVLTVIILTAVLSAGFFMFSKTAQAATYYASPTGSGTTCSSGSPCTLNYAVGTKAVNGDTVILQAGTYNQELDIAKEITVQGTLDGSGNRLSIIDPYTNISGSWTEDLSTGIGVYKKTLSRRLETMAVEISGTRYKIFKLCHDDDSALSYCDAWAVHLDRPTTTTFYNDIYGWGGYINFWDGFNVLFAVNADKETWIRFDDRSNVNSKTLLGATIGDDDGDTVYINANNVTIKDLMIYADVMGINIQSGKSGITINNNKILLGNTKIYAGTSNNLTITNNILTDQAYSDAYIQQYPRGAWTAYEEYNDYKNLINNHHYGLTKYQIAYDDGKRVSVGIQINSTNTANISNNYIHNMSKTIIIYSSGTAVTINNNTIKQSDFGILPAELSNSTISGNYIEDTTYAMRFHDWQGNLSGGNYYNNTDIKIYNNKIWQPLHKGGHIFFYYDPGESGTISTVGKLWFYHNSFSGGDELVNISSAAGNFTPRGMGGTYFIDNIFSSDRVYKDQSYSANPGGCWYNWLTGTYKSLCPTSSPSNNFDNGTTLMWTSSTPHNFTPAASAEAGKDISGSFVIGSTTYNSSDQHTPGFDSGYFSGAVPYIGAVQLGNNPNPTDVNSDNQTNIKDVQSCIKVITGQETDQTIISKCQAIANPTNITNIKDIQEIIRAIIGG